jgi:acetylornithine deacetylase
MHEGLTADGAIYLHPAESGAGMREIKAFCSGQIEFRVAVAGREPETTEPSHTAFAHRAVSAFDKALIVREALRGLDARRAARVRHELLEAAVGRSTNLLIGAVRAGGAPARVPTSCVFDCALAFPPPETLDAIKAEILAAVAAAVQGDPFLTANPPRVEFIAGTTGAETPASHPLYRAVADAIRATTGAAPFVNPLHTASDIRNPIVQSAIPTVGLGPLCGDLAQNGRTDEWIDVADFLRAIRAVARATVAWCG